MRCTPACRLASCRSNAAKLADVGIAKLHEVQAGNPTIHSTTIRIASTSLRGTPGFMAPEYLQYGRKGTFTDVYAAGVWCDISVGSNPHCGYWVASTMNHSMEFAG